VQYFTVFMDLVDKHPLSLVHPRINKARGKAVTDVCESVHPTQPEAVHQSIPDISLNLRKGFLLGTEDPSFGLQPMCRHCRLATAY